LQDKTVVQPNILRGCSGGNQINELAQMINLYNGHMSEGRRFSKITTIDGITNVKELSNIINLFNTNKVGSFFFQKSPFIVVARQNCFAIDHCTRML
jgi:hypothetical protein